MALFVPSAVPLIGMLMFGNLVKEIGSNTSRLFDAASNSIMNAATIFLGISVGATMTTDAFLNWTTIGIVIGGFLAFALFNLRWYFLCEDIQSVYEEEN